MFRRTSDLPLRRDATSAFLPWLVALMVFLSAVALAGAIVLSALISRWDRDVSGTLTVQVAPATGTPAEAAAKTRQRVEAAVKLLQDTPGVMQARALDRPELVALLEPWLGAADILQDMPLPQLIDVTLDARTPPDLAQLAKTVSAQVPGASLDDHRVWLSRLIALSRTIEWLALGVVAMIGAVTSATVVYATRTGMAVHRDVIELLHVIGAAPGYIAGQFAGRAFFLGLLGGVMGLGLAVPALLAIGWSARRIEGGFLPDLSLPAHGWAAVLVLPLAAALLAMVTARLTVVRHIARLR